MRLVSIGVIGLYPSTVSTMLSSTTSTKESGREPDQYTSPNGLIPTPNVATESTREVDHTRSTKSMPTQNVPTESLGDRELDHFSPRDPILIINTPKSNEDNDSDQYVNVIYVMAGIFGTLTLCFFLFCVNYIVAR